MQNVQVHCFNKDEPEYLKGYFIIIKVSKESMYLSGLEHNLWTSNCSVQILPTISFVPLGKLLNLLVSQFPQV